MAFCVKCGTQSVNNFCGNCGAPTSGPALITNAPTPSLGAAKSKTVAVLLAIFLSFCTWLYTYDRDKSKFWIGLGVGVASIILTAVGIGAIGVIGIYIWAIIDSATKAEGWYRDYPRG